MLCIIVIVVRICGARRRCGGSRAHCPAGQSRPRRPTWCARSSQSRARSRPNEAPIDATLRVRVNRAENTAWPSKPNGTYSAHESVTASGVLVKGRRGGLEGREIGRFP